MKKRILIYSISFFIAICITALLIRYISIRNERSAKSFSYFVENTVAKSTLEFANLDQTKPALVLFYSPTCRTCHEFAPLFNKLSKEYKDKYNFAALNIDDPTNQPLARFNVQTIPVLYIFDTEIGNKIHLATYLLGYEVLLKSELDRYLRIRKHINIDEARKEHEENLNKLEKELKVKRVESPQE